MKTLLLILVFFTGNAEAATRNFIPRGTGEGYIGLSTRAWAGVYADQFWGSGAGLTSLPAGELTGTVPTGSVDLSTVTTRFLAVEASTGVNAANISAVILSTAPLANAADWDTAYSWGNHASAGYLTSYTETDPLSVKKTGDTMTGDLALPNLNATYGVSAATGVFTTLYGDGSNLTGVIQSTATGNYLLRVATATYLATAPGACGAGEFINALTADGTKTCAAPAGGGDVVLASTQTFTGANTFANSINMNQVFVSSVSTGRHAFGGVTRETWYRNPSFYMALSSGTWDLSFHATIYMGRSASTAGHLTSIICMSTSTVAGTGLIDCNLQIALAPNQEFSLYSVNMRVIYTTTESKTIYIHGAINNYSGASADPSGFDIYSVPGIRSRTSRIEAVKIRD